MSLKASRRVAQLNTKLKSHAMSTKIQRPHHAQTSRKPRRSARRFRLWPGIAAMLLLAAFGTLAASNHVSKVLARVTAQLSAPAKAVAPVVMPAAAPVLTGAAYAAPQANNPAPPSSSPSALPALSPSGDWILAPDALPPTPPTGDILPLPVAYSAQDPGFHPVKVEHQELVGDRVILTCLNPETGGTEVITGKQGRDTVFTLKNPEAADLTTSQIKIVEPGNLVASRNPQTGKTEFGRVVRTIQRQADALVTVRLADGKLGQSETLTCTPEHPLYVQGQGWVEAGSLGIGSSVVSRARQPLMVQKVSWQRARSGTKPFTVYNLEVANSHTYFVGTASGGAWVHNGVSSVPSRGWGNSREYRDAVDRLKQSGKDNKDWVANDEQHARQFAEDAGLREDPETYGAHADGTYQAHPAEPNSGQPEPYNNMDHLKYSFGGGNKGHIWWP